LPERKKLLNKNGKNRKKNIWKEKKLKKILDKMALSISRVLLITL
jgi:hypothetical protein